MLQEHRQEDVGQKDLLLLNLNTQLKIVISYEAPYSSPQQNMPAVSTNQLNTKENKRFEAIVKKKY